MSVCLTQSMRFAGHVDSQRNFGPFKSYLIQQHCGHGDSQRNLRTCAVDKSRKIEYNIL